MQQLTPTTIAPGQEWDAKNFLDQVLQELIGNSAPEFQAVGLAIWSGMAVVMIVWTGLKTAFSGQFDAWEIVQLVIGLGIPRTMLQFYTTPIPGTSMSFPAIITAQGIWASNAFIGNTWKDLIERLSQVYNSVFNQFGEDIMAFGIGDVFTKGISFLVASVIGGCLMVLVLLLLLLMYCVVMAQVIWAQIALAICTLVGPLLIPWLIFPPMSFLFWGWFRTMITYTLYGVIAGAVLNVFMNVGMGFLERLLATALNFTDLAGTVKWYIILLPLILSGCLASLKVGELAQMLVSGGGAASAGLGQRARQVAMAAKTGGASMAAGGK